MRLLTGPGVFTKRHAGFQFRFTGQNWLHDWLTRACMSCFAFSGPTPSSPSSPGSMARSTASCSTCPEVGSRGGSDRSRSSCDCTACRFASHTLPTEGSGPKAFYTPT